MGIVDIIDLDLSSGVTEEEFLEYFVILVDKLSSFYKDVSLHSINLITESNSQMFAR